MKTILVLEDEPSLMNLMNRVLRRYGYTILEAADAEEAIRQFKNNDRQIDLLIADVSLPAISGVQVALLLRAELPDLGVILTSGYPTHAWTIRDSRHLLRLGSDSVCILLKPFTPGILLNTISGLIGTPPSEVLSARTFMSGSSRVG
ncbi:MAG: response regulator [Acidobacteriia bacterium]|nr:response regulator [Terriglobia bacterium]